MNYKVLTINPGSTSTKIALYNEQGEVWSQTLCHPAEQIARYGRIAEQFEWNNTNPTHVLYRFARSWLTA